ncbi:hypothetical protein Tsp_01275 [Trichinella spiralis]|uniref:hypothetical protein n=1 Tax=Trichinella spiralis TaxID=6334 RepID=UPI0001EFCC64|nr:hypothetical protein Tsp_01275 [Trichinella spiralis]
MAVMNFLNEWNNSNFAGQRIFSANGQGISQHHNTLISPLLFCKISKRKKPLQQRLFGKCKLSFPNILSFVLFLMMAWHTARCTMLRLNTKCHRIWQDWKDIEGANRLVEKV